jgi:hypothetical protein
MHHYLKEGRCDMETSKIVNLNDGYWQAPYMEPGGLTELLQDYLKRAGYPCWQLDGCIGTIVEGRVLTHHLLVFADDSGDGPGKIEIINADLLGVNLNAVDYALRHEVLELSMRLNTEYILVKLGISKKGSLMLMAEFTVVDAWPTFKFFMSYFEAVLVIGDMVYPDFKRVIFPEKALRKNI